MRRPTVEGVTAAWTSAIGIKQARAAAVRAASRTNGAFLNPPFGIMQPWKAAICASLNRGPLRGTQSPFEARHLVAPLSRARGLPLVDTYSSAGFAAGRAVGSVSFSAPFEIVSQPASSPAGAGHTPIARVERHARTASNIESSALSAPARRAGRTPRGSSNSTATARTDHEALDQSGSTRYQAPRARSSGPDSQSAFDRVCILFHRPSSRLLALVQMRSHQQPLIGTQRKQATGSHQVNEAQVDPRTAADTTALQQETAAAPDT